MAAPGAGALPIFICIVRALGQQSRRSAITDRRCITLPLVSQLKTAVTIHGIAERPKMKSVRLFVCSLLGCAVMADAQDTNSVDRLPEIVVTGTRLPEETVPLASFPANVTVITRTDIDQNPAFTLSELLRQETGFTLLDSAGSFGSQRAPFSLRGYGEKAGTLLTVDGVRANDGGDGFFLWNSVPLENIERIEIIRGGASTQYGEGAVGGVINIVTRKGTQKPFAFESTAAAGNLGYYKAGLQASGQTNWFSYLFSGQHQQWSGWRDSSGFIGLNGLAKLGADTAAGKFTASYTYHTERGGNPGPLTEAQFQANPKQAGAPVFSFTDRLHRGELGWTKEFEAGWSATANVNAQAYQTHSTGFGLVTTEQPGYGGVLQISKQSTFWDRENRLAVGGEVSHLDFSQVAFGTTTVHDSTLTGAFLQDSLELCEKLTLSAGLRFDHRRTFLNVPFAFPAFTGVKENSLWSPKVGLTYEFTEKSAMWVTFSDSKRLPSANDVVSGDPRFPSSPGLIPLKARTVETGIRYEHSKVFSGSLVWYHSWVHDDIYTDPNPPAFGGNVNGDVTRQGVELTLKVRPAEWIELQTGTTFSDARFDSGVLTGKRMVLVPEWQLRGGVIIRPATGWTWSIEDLYSTGQVRFFDVNNTLAQNQYNVLNTKISYEWNQLTAFAAVNNLLDRVYEQFPTSMPFVPPNTPQYNPAPGINFQLGLTVKF